MNRLIRSVGVVIAVSLIGAFVQPLRASDKSVVRDLLARWQSWQGGMGVYPIVRSCEVEEEVSFGTDQAPWRVKFVRTADGRFRFEVTRPNAATVVQAFDGRFAWQKHPEWGAGSMPNPAADPWVWQNDLLLAARSLLPPIKASAVRRIDWKGRKCLVATITDATGFKGKCYFNASTQQLVRIERSPTPGQETVAVDLDDYRPVSGLAVPHLVRVQFGGTTIVHRRTRVVVNPQIDAASMVLSTADVQSIVACDEILTKHSTSIGPPEVLARIQSRVTQVSVEIASAGTKSVKTISQKSPNLVLVETDTPGMGRESRGFDGKIGWLNSELQGYRPLKPAELGLLQSESKIHLVERLSETCPFRRWVGERLVKGQKTTALSLATLYGPIGTFFFDQASGRLIRIGLPVSEDRNFQTESSIDFADFRRVDGVEIPFQLVQTSAVAKVVSTVLSVKNNPPLADALFHPRVDD